MQSKNRLEKLPPEHRLQVQFALAAFGCMNADNIVQISTSITTGKLLYAYMKEHGFKTLEEAKADEKAFFKAVIEPNIKASMGWVDVWKGRTKGVVISPGAFESCREGADVTWSQDAFMGMWLSFIDQKVTKEVMQEGWAYSDGAGEEYQHIVCMQMGLRSRSNIKVLDTDGRQIKLDKGITAVAEAFKDLHDQGIAAPRIARTLARLFLLEERYAAGEITAEAISASTVAAYNRKSFLSLKEEVMPILKAEYPEMMTFLAKQKSADFTPINVLEETPAAGNDNKRKINPSSARGPKTNRPPGAA